jgi:hypothetical protein
MARSSFPTIRQSGIAVLNFRGPYYRISAASPVALGCSHDGVQRNSTGPTSFCHMSNAQFLPSRTRK